MLSAPTTPADPLPPSPASSIRATLADAARFWEPRRILYNVVLAAVTIAWFAHAWPNFRAEFTLPGLIPLSVLALIANLLYCAAYFIDVPMQLTPFSALWKRRRWILWLAGTLLAFAVTNYWIADEVLSGR
jgi:hypothetical protein